MAARKKGAGITPAHKSALRKGREEGRIVRAYLEALRANKPKRGRKRTAATARKQLGEVEAKLNNGVTNPCEELRLVQRKLDLEAEMRAMSTPKVDMAKLEVAFCKVAASFGARHGITRASWREVGVPAATLKRAGIK